jgi:hypothetical protein
MPSTLGIPDPNRRRRNPDRVSPVFIPSDARNEDVPEPLGFLAGPGMAWWNWAWRLNIATQWTDADLSIVTRRAQLQDQWEATKDKALAAEMRQIDDRLGLNPRARAQLRWSEPPANSASTARATQTEPAGIPDRWRNVAG